MALDPATLHHGGQHDDEGRLLLPHHVPVLHAGVRQRTLIIKNLLKASDDLLGHALAGKHIIKGTEAKHKLVLMNSQ